MKCPYCNSQDTGVVDSRVTARESVVRRRRECPACKMRFTTYERFESTAIMVVKRNGRRQEFEREKIRRGILMACEKRPVEGSQIDAIVDCVEETLRRNNLHEVESRIIGSLVLEELRELDEVAYLRFASVCRNFEHVDEFIEELENLRKATAGEKKDGKAVAVMSVSGRP